MELEELLNSLIHEPGHPRITHKHLVFIMGSVPASRNLDHLVDSDAQSTPFEFPAHRDVGSENRRSEGFRAALAVHRVAVLDHVLVLLQGVVGALQVEEFLVLTLNKRGQVSVDLAKLALLLVCLRLL